MSKIYVAINYRVNQKSKVQNVVDAYIATAGVEITDLTIERYWKEADQMQATFFITLGPMSREEKTFKVLTLANMLAKTTQYRWTFVGPHVNKDLTFGCILQNDRDDDPLVWANIELED